MTIGPQVVDCPTEAWKFDAFESEDLCSRWRYMGKIPSESILIVLRCINVKFTNGISLYQYAQCLWEGNLVWVAFRDLSELDRRA